MTVNVNKTGSYRLPGSIDHLGVFHLNTRGNFNNFLPLDQNIALIRLFSASVINQSVFDQNVTHISIPLASTFCFLREPFSRMYTVFCILTAVHT